MVACHIIVLFLTTVVVTSYNIHSHDDAGKHLEHALKDLLSANEHYSHNSHHHQKDHDLTKIGNLNLIFKHNNILNPSARSKTKAIERDGANDGSSSLLLNNFLCKLGARCGCGSNAERCGCSNNAERCGCGNNAERCGCGNNAERCGCGRSGEPCTDDHDHTMDGAALLNLEKEKSKGDASLTIEKDTKNRADLNIIKLLDDLESTIIGSNNENQGKGELSKDNGFQVIHVHDDKSQKRDVLLELKSLFDSTGKKDVDNESYLQCYQGCAKTNINLFGKIDDKAYIRCSKKCNSRSGSKPRDDVLVEKDVEDKKSEQVLRCCKSCGGNRAYRTDDRAYLRCCKKCHTRTSEPSDDGSSNSINELLSRAKVFQINEDFDAVVLDVADVDNALKILNIGNNLDNSNSIRDYTRVENKPLQKSVSHNAFKPTYGGDGSKSKSLRRDNQPDVEKYGLPFELDVQALGQANP